MTYRIELTKGAERALRRIHPKETERIRAAIDGLAENPRPQNSTHLVGRPVWRMRVGNYRVIYDITDGQLMVTVVKVGHRGDVYRS